MSDNDDTRAERSSLPTQPDSRRADRRDPSKPLLERSADCEDAEIALAARQTRTLSSREAATLASHLARCARCRSAADAHDGDWQWVSRIPASSPGTGPLLPIVDPQMFTVERELASGGMGRVSLATDRRLGREVALKEILDPDFRDRFEREAFITAHLQHPAIIPIYEAGTWPDGSAFYTMRLVEGTTLQGVIDAAKTLPARLALLHHVIATVEAIAYAHGKRIVHRDLKTSNVLVGELGDTVVIDWGLAKRLEDTPDTPAPRRSIPSSAELTRVGSVLGTPCFMAPEQARGEPTDERADVFALGAILYTLLAGIPPYLDRADTDGELAMQRVIAGPPRSLRELAPDTPDDLLAITERAMAHDKADRYPTARELAAELRRFEAGQLLARPYGIGELVRRWIRKHRALVVTGALALAVIAVVAAFAVINVTRSRAAERVARIAADDARVKAELREAAVLEEQARVALLRGDNAEALVLASEALQRGRDTHVLRFLIGSALRDRDLVGTHTTVAGFDTVALASDGEGAPLALSMQGEVTRGDKTLFTITEDVDAGWFSPDGTWIVVVGEDGVSRWDVARGIRVWGSKTRVDTRNPKLVVASEAGWLATTHRRNTTLLRADTGELIATLVADDDVTSVALGPDGKLAIADARGHIDVYEGTTRKRIHRWVASEEQDFLAFVGEDVASGAGPTASIWNHNIDTFAPVALHHESPIGMMVSAMGVLVTSTVNGHVRVWSATGALLGSGALGESLERITIAPDGRALLAISSAEATYHSLPGLEPGFTTKGTFGEVSWDRRYEWFALVDKDRKRAVPLRRPTRRLLGAAVDGIAASIFGDRVVIHGRSRGVVTSFDATPLQEVAPSPNLRYEASRDGHRQMIVTADDFVLWDPLDGVAIARYPQKHPSVMRDGGRAGFSAVSPDGSVAAFSEPGSSAFAARLVIVDGKTGAVLVEREYPEDLEPTQFTFLSNRELVVYSNRAWQVWDRSTLNARELRAQKSGFAHVIDEARVLLYGSQNIVLDTRTGAQLAAFPTTNYITKVQTSARGDVFALGASGVALIFTLADPEHPRSVISPASDFALTSDGKRMFTADAGLISVWETDTGRLLDRFRAAARAERLELSGDDSTLLVEGGFVAGVDGVSLWDAGLDTHRVSELVDIVRASGWTFADGVARAP